MSLKSSIKYSENEITEILLKNTLLMLEERGILKKKDHKKNLKNLYNQIKDDMLFNISDNKTKVGIRIVKYKVTSITKVEGIDQFLNDKTYNERIIIFKEMNQKTFKQLISYKNTQPFWEKDLMMNIIDHNYVPKHYVLTEEEKIEFIKSYQITRDTLPKIKLYDAISRYYNMKVGDIVQITRKNILSGEELFYRVVVPSVPQDLF